MYYTKLCLSSTLVVMVFVVSETAPVDEMAKVLRKNKGCDCVCGISNRHMRVVGGNETEPHEFPWIASLIRNGEFQCGATLITRRHILTAAHCLKGSNIRDLSIVLAEHDRQAPNRLATIVVRSLKNIKQHEDFDRYTFNNDIAILELDRPVDFSSSVQPACLPQKNMDYTGKEAVVAGWGNIGEKDITSNTLQKVILPVWSRDQCRNSNYGEKRITENMFCAGYSEGKRDACKGDSGGPLHSKNSESGVLEIIGIVSWGRGCARPNFPGVYTKISNYMDWVINSLDDECLCHP